MISICVDALLHVSVTCTYHFRMLHADLFGFIPAAITLYYCKIDLKTLKTRRLSVISLLLHCSFRLFNNFVAFRHFDCFNTCFSTVIFYRSWWLLKGVLWFHRKAAPHIPLIVWSRSRQILVVEAEEHLAKKKRKICRAYSLYQDEVRFFS